jgi:predicted ATPase
MKGELKFYCMELLFIWISDFRNISNQGFNFSGAFYFTYEKEKDILKIRNLENETPINFFGDNILNATAIIGNNGVGKTELLHFIRAFPTNYHSPSIIILGKRPSKIGEPWEIRISTHNTLKKIKLHYEFEIPKQKITIKEELIHGTGTNDPLHKLLNKDVMIAYLNYGLSIRPGGGNSFSSDISTISLMEKASAQAATRNKTSTNQEVKLNALDEYRFDELERNCIYIMNDEYKKSIVLTDKRLEWLGISFNNIVTEYIDSHNFIQKLNEHQVFRSYLRQLLRNSSNEKVGGTWLRINNLSIARIFFGIAICFRYRKSLDFDISKMKLGEIQESLLRIINTEVPEAASFYKYIFKLKSKLLQTELRVNLKEKEPFTYMDFFAVQFRLRINEAKNWIKEYRKTKFDTPLLSYYWNLSSGEASLLSHFSRLYSLRESVIGKTVWLQIDEADIHLHPEWQLEFFNAYIDYLSNTFPNSKFQLFLATHSPFILSDIPAYHNIFLQRINGMCEVVDDALEGGTFGGNLHTLYRNTFFLKNGFIGKFAQKTINNIIKSLSGNKKLDSNKSRQIKNVILSIGEPIIKNKLIQMYEDKELLDSDERINDLEIKVEKLIANQKRNKSDRS